MLPPDLVLLERWAHLERETLGTEDSRRVLPATRRTGGDELPLLQQALQVSVYRLAGDRKPLCRQTSDIAPVRLDAIEDEGLDFVGTHRRSSARGTSVCHVGTCIGQVAELST